MSVRRRASIKRIRYFQKEIVETNYLEDHHLTTRYIITLPLGYIITLPLGYIVTLPLVTSVTVVHLTTRYTLPLVTPYHSVH